MSLICTCFAHQLRIAGGCGCSAVPDGFVAIGKEEEEEQMKVKTGGFAETEQVLQSLTKARKDQKANVTKPKVTNPKVLKPKVGKKPKFEHKPEK